MILRWLGFLLLLATLAGLVVSYPFLWEIGILGLIGGIYWIFFRH